MLDHFFRETPVLFPIPHNTKNPTVSPQRLRQGSLSFPLMVPLSVFGERVNGCSLPKSGRMVQEASRFANPKIPSTSSPAYVFEG
jgi:hypothetical protein